MARQGRAFGLTFGALAQKIRDQLKAQSMAGAPPHTLRRWQEVADALTYCAVRGWLPESAVSRARQRLLQDVAETIHEVEAT